MNWKEEIERVSFDVSTWTNDEMSIGYQIGNVLFAIQADYWKDGFDHEEGRFNIDIKLLHGVWWTEEDTTDKEMELTENLKQWILGMLNYLITERDFLFNYLTEEDDFNYWCDYGI